jgi:hypothetical protein
MSKKGLKGCHEKRRGSRGIERKLGKFYYDLGISDCFMFAFHRLSRTGRNVLGMELTPQHAASRVVVKNAGLFRYEINVPRELLSTSRASSSDP